VRSQFNHRCCETVEEFERVSGFAITKQGLIRSGGTRHIKDDTRNIHDPRHFILGWRNQEKIRSLEAELGRLMSEVQQRERERSEAQAQQQRAQRRARFCSQLAGFRSFLDIDWRSTAKHRAELQLRKEELERSSDKVQELRQQLEALKKQIAAAENEKTQLAKEKGSNDNQYGQCQLRHASCMDTLAGVRESEIDEFKERFQELTAGKELTVRNAEHSQFLADKVVGDEVLETNRRREGEAKAATRLMERYLGQFAEEKADLAAEEKYLPEFLKLRDSIAADDLPRHEERFKELMSHDVLAHVASFQDRLETHCEEIEAKINHLNDALRSIEYTARTYIRIRAAQTNDNDVREFRHRLKSCLEFGLNADAAAREAAFRRITELITRFREKPDWASKVTDTRMWLLFAVEELRREDDSQENYYSDTGGKSGGQKAKLAFTILASAIAYQYGIAHSRSNPESFRFVVIDEMFARSDETNARYALQLFATFHLQLLIVCPLDARARVVEPFVSSYHLTLNPTTEESCVRTITVEEVARRLTASAPMAKAHATT
jgi:uncharacterized protein YPO0396